MGYDARCTLDIDGRTFRGTAHLEHKDLTFRGETRLVIPLRDIREIQAREGDLIVRFGEKAAVLRIGASAAKWAERIAHPRSRLDKLGVKAGMRVAVIAVDDEELVPELESREVIIERQSKALALDVIFLGLRQQKDLATLAAMKRRLRPTGAIWAIRIKGPAATITEAESMAAGKRAGLVDVKVVSFSETHSAEKYVIPVAQRSPAARSASPSPRTRGSVPSRGRR